MKLNQELIKKGFRIENGRLEKYTIEGRKRKNWKSNHRGKSQKFMKEKCEKCGSTENLTIHHVIPLSKNVIISEKNCSTLCRKCHDKVHGMIPNGKKNKKIKKKVRSKKHKTKKKKIGVLWLEQDEWGSFRIID